MAVFIGDIHRIDTTTSTFANLIEQGSLYVDKTAFIEHFINNPSRVQIVCRQRRLGKSLNLDMLRCFLTDAEDYRHLFEGLYIRKSPVWAMAHSTPTFLFDFKGLDPRRFRNMIRDQVHLAIHRYIDNPKCPAEVNATYESWYRSDEPDPTGISQLITAAYHVTGKQPVVLVDEYDKLMMDNMGDPAKYKEIRDYLTLLFSNAFKGNLHLGKALMTGVMRVSHEGMLSGLNNPKTYDLFRDKAYTEDYGFTESEMQELQAAAGFDLDKARDWYNGIRVDGNAIYNTYGTLRMIKSGKFRCYWGNTGSLNTAASLLTAERKRVIMELLEPGATARVPLEMRISPEKLMHNSTDADFYSFLAQAGYLALEDFDVKTGDVSVPNEELREVWRDFIFERVMEGRLAIGKNPFNFADTGALAADLQEYLSNALDDLSYFDLGANLCDDGKWRTPEIHYHCLVFGLLYAAQTNIGFERIRSNRESGDGRYDIGVEFAKFALVLEIKSAADDEDLDELAAGALAQIRDNRYAAEYKGKLVTGVGLAFRKKDCRAAAARIA